MIEIRKTDSLDLTPEVDDQLSRMMSRIIHGDDSIIEGPLAKVPNIKEKFLKWFEAMQLKMPLQHNLLDVENSNQDKFGPRSIALPWSDRIEGTEAYFEVSDGEIPDLQLPQTSTGRLRPLSLKIASDYIKRTTNSGLPYIAKKGKVLDEAVANFQQLLDRMDPCILFTRTQEQKKTRPVWGFPIADTLNEMMFYRPLLEHQKQSGYRAAVIGPEAVDTGVSKLMKFASENNLQLVSIDFSAYDTSIRPELSMLCFDYIKSLYQTSYHDNLDYIFERFVSIGLVTPDGIYTGEHGVPSGSTFTNEIDSLVQWIIAINYPGEKLVDFQIQGDDGLYAVTDPEKLMDWFTQFGLKVNKEKSLISDDTAQYLQLTYNPMYEESGEFKGIYSVSRAFNRICYPERFTDFTRDDIDGKSYFAIRAISILENCKYHPWFEDFVRFILKQDKYNLEISEQSLTNYIKLRDKEDGRDINFNIYQYGDYARGIKSFASYELVRKMIQNSLNTRVLSG
jgi:hypothetical protein